MKFVDPNKIEVYYNALVDRNPKYLGEFYAAVKTTSIFCLPTCSARKPKPENVEYYSSSQEAMTNGYRACRRCHPLEYQAI